MGFINKIKGGFKTPRQTVFNSVPPFKMYFPTVGSMSNKQRAFYQHWLDRWQAGNPIDVNGNISYLFVYCYEVLSWHEKKAYDKIIAELRRLRSAYAHEEKFAQHLLWWLSDTYVLKRDFESALAVMHALNPSLNSIVTLKRLANERMTASEVLYLTPKPALTKFGREHNLGILDQLSDVLREYETKRGVNLLEVVTKRRENERIKKYPELKEWQGYSVYNGSFYQHFIPDLSEHELDWDEVRARGSEFKGMVREAENRVREMHKVPRIGEGWVSETELYNMVSTLLKRLGYDVRRHARPGWLNRQELDIYVPALKLAIEYMGEQHYEPVGYFGGKEAHEKLVELDERKRRACKQRGVHLIYYRYDEPLKIELVRERLAEHPSLTLEIFETSQEKNQRSNHPKRMKKKSIAA